MASELFNRLEKTIYEYDRKNSELIAKQIIEEKENVLKAIEVMTSAIQIVGDKYASGEFYLPDLIGASSAMLSALPHLEVELKNRGEKRESLGKVVIGTVYGDIHNIGKAIVATLLTASGFTVFDLGTNIKPGEFIAEIKRRKADILAMSALMTTTAPEQRLTIEKLKEEGIREDVIIVVGGSAITQKFADLIGADGYATTAPEAVNLAMRLVEDRKRNKELV